MKASEVKIGDIVFVTDSPKATEWEIINKEGHNVELREKDTDFKAHWLDCCYIKRRK